ncbi:MAG: peptide ABC transporter permease [Deltaproteobacteria bacterium CG_4_9_14_3_um_filter_63_12]|nr:MAG: peptide ABC transporter permease [Deltaproteobacteria bacterium CG_4_9_14_3_um_filter_63_12]
MARGRLQSLKRFARRRPLAIVGGAILALLVFFALAADWLAPGDPTLVEVRLQLCEPSSQHLLGCDENGRDVLTLIIYGSRVALAVGLTSVLVSMTCGVLLGATAGFFRGWTDEVVMRVADICFAFPGILLAILIIFLTQNPSVMSVVLALSATGWASYARLVRGEVLRERELTYVEAARALGLPSRRIVVRYILPNVMAPLSVQATFGVAGAILAESSLSFLGLGPSMSAFWGVSWGALLDQGASYFLLTPHLAIAPGVAIMLAVLGINFVGDALRDELDPRLRGQIGGP